MKSSEYIDIIIESFDDLDFQRRQTIVDIHDVEEEIEEIKNKEIIPNSKIIKARGKHMTVFQYHTLIKKELLDHLRNKLKNLNTKLDDILVQIKLKENL